MSSVGVVSSTVVAASAHIVARAATVSGEVLSQVTILGQSLTSKAIIPVFRRTASTLSGATIADNTGIALSGTLGRYVLTLRDSQGLVVSARTLYSCPCPAKNFSGHFAAFITEIFLDLPTNFDAGSLTIEHEGSIPMAFAAVALYVRGNEITSAAVTPIDRPGTYFVRLKSTESQQRAQEMANQYGFAIERFFTSVPLTAIVIMTNEVARAVARDPRVEFVEPDAVFPFAG